MMRKQHGFSLVELMVALVIFTFAIAAATMIFIPLVNTFKQQSKIAETNIEGLVGLELLKTDLEHAGYGLPGCFQNNSITYKETAVAPASSLNDAPSNPPRALASFNNSTFSGTVNGNANITQIASGSDYLVIRSSLVSGTDASKKYSYIVAQSEPNTKVWATTAGQPDFNNPVTSDYVIVINPMGCSTSSLCFSSAHPASCLVMNGTATAFSLGNGFTQYSPTAFPAAFSPNPLLDPLEAYLINDLASQAGTAGTDLNGPLTMPFNRADYFVGIPSVSTKPTRCAIGTGVLYKAVLNQDGTFHANDMLPLLDCVADMQVIFGLDLSGDGVIDTYSNADGISATDATNITGQGGGFGTQAAGVLASQTDLSSFRSAVQEVRIYILAHEGQMDPSFTFPAANNPILVGSLWNGDNAAYGRSFDLTQLNDPNWNHYRWKVYTIVVKLLNVH